MRRILVSGSIMTLKIAEIGSDIQAGHVNTLDNHCSDKILTF